VFTLWNGLGACRLDFFFYENRLVEMLQDEACTPAVNMCWTSTISLDLVFKKTFEMDVDTTSLSPTLLPPTFSPFETHYLLRQTELRSLQFSNLSLIQEMLAEETWTLMRAWRSVRSQPSLQPTFPFCICVSGLYLWHVEANIPYHVLFFSVLI